MAQTRTKTPLSQSHPELAAERLLLRLAPWAILPPEAGSCALESGTGTAVQRAVTTFILQQAAPLNIEQFVYYKGMMRWWRLICVKESSRR